MLSQQQINSAKKFGSVSGMMCYVSAELIVPQGLQYGILAGHMSLQVQI